MRIDSNATRRGHSGGLGCIFLMLIAGPTMIAVARGLMFLGVSRSWAEMIGFLAGAGVAFFVVTLPQRAKEGATRGAAAVVLAMAGLVLTGIVAGVVSFVRRLLGHAPSKTDPGAGISSAAFRWAGHVGGIAFGSILHGLLHLILGAVAGIGLGLALVAFGVVPRIGAGLERWAIPAWEGLVLAGAGLVVGMVTGAAHRMKRVIGDEKEVERIWELVRPVVAEVGRSQAGRLEAIPIAELRKRVGQGLDRIETRAADEKPVGWGERLERLFARRVNRFLGEEIAGGITARSLVRREGSGELTFDVDRMETLGIAAVKEHLTRAFEAYAFVVALVAGLVALALAALPVIGMRLGHI